MASDHPLPTSLLLRRAPLAMAALLALNSHAQTETVTVTARTLARPPAITGFGSEPLERSPIAAAVYDVQSLRTAGVRQFGELVKLDASLGNAYNAEGYWGSLSARGYAINNRYNVRRDGLPINGETALAFDALAGVEILKGTSGIQAGTSAPGGLVNLVVKRPDAVVRSARLEARQGGSRLAAVDLSDRFGADETVGLRLNAAYEHLDPRVRSTEGHRWLLALAGDWRVTRDSLLELEFESSRQRQPSVVGFSMLGDAVPDAHDIDPRLNLNNQPWTHPVAMVSDVASLRFTQRVGDGWRARAHAMTQRLRMDDYTAFPFGVYDANYACTICDRFAPDGSFTYWEYISQNERRRSDALDLSLAGQWTTGPVRHGLQAGVLFTRQRVRPEATQVFDIAGTGNIDGSAVTQPSAGFTDFNTRRDERSTEWYLRDAIQFDPQWSAWLGLRHTRLQRTSERLDPDDRRAVDYKQGTTIPWLALAYQATERWLVYASWGRGLESEVVPNRPTCFSNAGAPFTLKSRQAELGLKYDGPSLGASLAVFEIDRPQLSDSTGCPSSPVTPDGSARHRGIEGQAAWRTGPWLLRASAMLLDAERRGTHDAMFDGKRPINVPRSSLRLAADHQFATVPQLVLGAALHAEGRRAVLADNSAHIGGWARVDLHARWQHKTAGTTLTWRAGVDNVADRRAWKEAPNQFGHVYLYPLAPRTFRVSLQADL